MNLKILLSIVIVIIVTDLMFWAPWSINLAKDCGGCSYACPGDCSKHLGAPFTMFYWGHNGAIGRNVHEVSPSGIILNMFIWSVLMLLNYRHIYKTARKR